MLFAILFLDYIVRQARSVHHCGLAEVPSFRLLECFVLRALCSLTFRLRAFLRCLYVVYLIEIVWSTYGRLMD